MSSYVVVMKGLIESLIHTLQVFYFSGSLSTFNLPLWLELQVLQQVYCSLADLVSSVSLPGWGCWWLV